MENHFVIWDFVSLAWTEIGPNEKDYDDCAKLLAEKYENWNDINRIIVRDVCGSFSLESGSLLFFLVPIIGILFVTPMPDWGYEENYLKQRMEKWERSTIILKYLNPVRLLGYPIALYFVWGLRRKLKKAFINSGAF